MKNIPLGEIIKLEYGKPLPREDRVEGGKYPAYGANGVKARTNKFYIDERGIIVGRKGSAGAVTLSDGPFWPLDVTYYVTFDKLKYDLKYIYWLLRTLDLPSLAVGVKPGINRNEVYAIRVPAPGSIQEQHQTVDALEAALKKIDRTIRLTQANLCNAVEYPNSWLKSALSDRHDHTWKTDSLSTLVSFRGGGTPSKANEGYWSGDIPWVSPKDMKTSRITDTRDHISELAVRVSSTSIVPHDSILLVVRSGILAHSIPLAINDVDVTLNQDMKALIPNGKISSQLLFYILLAYKEKLLDLVSKGATVHRLNFDQLKLLRITYPMNPLDQEKLEVDCKIVLERSYELQKAYSERLSDLAKLKDLLLNRAFEGKV